jgi:hypothetical protein
MLPINSSVEVGNMNCTLNEEGYFILLKCELSSVLTLCKGSFIEM